MQEIKVINTETKEERLYITQRWASIDLNIPNSAISTWLKYKDKFQRGKYIISKHE